MPPLIELRTDSTDPAYRQIANALRRHLVDGTLEPGTLLPPVRQIALDLNVHFNTVAQAYRILADEGWLDLKRRRGALVLERGARAADPGQMDALVHRLRELMAEFRSVGLTERQIATALQRLAKGAR